MAKVDPDKQYHIFKTSGDFFHTDQTSGCPPSLTFILLRAIHPMGYHGLQDGKEGSHSLAQRQEKTLRLFVAIDLPSEIKNQLESIGGGLPGARWVPAEQLHLTMRFIGEVEGSIFLDIQEELAELQAKQFPLQLKGVGCFSAHRQPKVVWVGVAPNPKLLHFQKKIEAVLVREAGLEPEKRKYSPHITLARLKDTPERRVGNFLEEYGLLETKKFTVDRFTLFSSLLTPRGAKHRVEAEYLLDDSSLKTTRPSPP